MITREDSWNTYSVSVTEIEKACKRIQVMVMKELSIEEKSKRYDELLEKLQKAKVDKETCDEGYCSVIDDIVTEFKESKDERISKEIIEYFKHYSGGDDCSIKFTKWIDWLEKRGSVGKLNEKLRQYREYLIKETESWHKKEQDETLSKIGKQDCIGHANAYISARSKFEDLFNYDSCCDEVNITAFVKEHSPELLKALEKSTEVVNKYPKTLDGAIDLYCYTYGNGKGGFDNLSFDKFRDITKQFVEDYGKKSTSWSEDDEIECNHIIKILTSVAKEQENKDYNNLINSISSIDWLKSLKER